MELSKGARTSLTDSLGFTSPGTGGIESKMPDRRKRQAAPKSFANSFELTTPGLEDSDGSATSTRLKRKADGKSSITPTKRSKRLTA